MMILYLTDAQVTNVRAVRYQILGHDSYNNTSDSLSIPLGTRFWCGVVDGENRVIHTPPFVLYS